MRKDTSMEYLPTVDMYGYFYINPTQGVIYKTQCQALMNLQTNDPGDYGTEGYKPLVSQECVRNNHSDRNEVVATQTGKLKYIRRYNNMLTYAQAVIAG